MDSISSRRVSDVVVVFADWDEVAVVMVERSVSCGLTAESISCVAASMRWH